MGSGMWARMALHAPEQPLPMRWHFNQRRQFRNTAELKAFQGRESMYSSGRYTPQAGGTSEERPRLRVQLPLEEQPAADAPTAVSAPAARPATTVAAEAATLLRLKQVMPKVAACMGVALRPAHGHARPLLGSPPPVC